MDFASTIANLRSNTFLRELLPDPDFEQNVPNKKMRPVRTGHYVPVMPTPLPLPKLVMHSPEMASALGLSEEHCTSEDFVRFFSGDSCVVPGSETWATPYALSIYGQFQENSQCPFRNGMGYGDGRAISIQEVLAPSGQRWELQLKGAGTTPFCRGGDGRSVLRSSIREFLVSEAMHHLGVGTTRALSLIVCCQEKVTRPIPEATIRGMQTESCAITCRVAPSFLRVGHFEVFGRRVSSPPQDCQPEKEALQCLKMLVDHALRREFGGVPEGCKTDADRAWALLIQAAKKVAHMTTDWLRVGFCQGNFNSDNCLISGNTMDYGPFGFVEEFDPRFGSWVGRGSHFAFMNQPQAGLMNIRSLTEALVPILGADEDEAFAKVKGVYLQESEEAKAEMWRQKLGLQTWSSEAAGLLSDFLRLMEDCGADWTITWRQLAACMDLPKGTENKQLLEPLLRIQSHASGIKSQEERWLNWLKRWTDIVDQTGDRRASAQMMRETSPKYVPREWMLKEAYIAAEQGDTGLMKELFELFKKPFAEQEAFEKYFVCKPKIKIS